MATVFTQICPGRTFCCILLVVVSLIVLNYNGEKLIKSCLDSLVKLDYAKKEIIFIDNASSDGSVNFVLKHYPNVRVIANTENSGYAGGADQAVRVSRGDFVMVLNPDIIFEPNYLNVLVARLRRDPEIGAIVGKLRKYNFERGEKTNLIDSAGLLMFRNRRCVDRGQGEEDHGQYDEAEEVFGITGACPLYRKSALEDIRVDNEYFDTSFFMYKEDVDISWRLRLRGWKCFYEPAATGYHGRGTGVFSRDSMRQVAKGRKKLSRFQKHYSYKNERLMRAKNDMWENVWCDIGPILWKELLMSGWIVLREPYLLRSFGQFLLGLPRAIRRRYQIMGRKKVNARQMRKWFK